MYAIDKPKRKAIDANTCLNKHGTDRQNDRPTDRPTDGRTDRPSYRDAWTHLKNINIKKTNMPFLKQFLPCWAIKNVRLT